LSVSCEKIFPQVSEKANRTVGVGKQSARLVIYIGEK